MCGLTGVIWSAGQQGISPETLDAMTDTLAHRGPDGRGVYWHSDNRGGVALGHRRLAIIDTSLRAAQPLWNEDGSVAVVFNGEIYNERQLRQELLRRGHRFRSESDTEVLVHLYEDDGDAFLAQLNGMFALAIWDAHRQRLLFARDRFGKKPLYYAVLGTTIVFGSELKSLLASSLITPTLDRDALDLYLTYQYIPHPKTIWRGVQKLPPAHRGVWSQADATLSIDAYWQLDVNCEDRSRSRGDWEEELRETVRDAVRLRMRSDVPVGAFLSGGVDSSITASLMQSISQSTSTTPIKTFSVGFRHREYDETQFAQMVATRCGSDHHPIMLDTPSLEAARSLIGKLVWHYDEPFADASAIPTWFLAEETRRHVVVALSGDGGDELFAGYLRYRAMRLGDAADWLPLALRRFLAGPLRRLIPASVRQHSWQRQLRRLLEAAVMSAPERYRAWIAMFDDNRRSTLYNDNTYSSRDSHDFISCVANAIHRDTTTRWSLADLATYLPCDLMTKVDVASMAHGLECRCPLLDYRVVELAAAMPVAMKVRRGRGKAILREAFRDLLPPEIDRRAKRGFGAPLDHWFRGVWSKLLDETILSQDSPLIEILRREELVRLVDEHRVGISDHASRLWGLVVLDRWLRDFSVSLNSLD